MRLVAADLPAVDLHKPDCMPRPTENMSILLPRNSATAIASRQSAKCSRLIRGWQCRHLRAIVLIAAGYALFCTFVQRLAYNRSQQPPTARRTAANPRRLWPRSSDSRKHATKSAIAPHIVDDDGKSLWVSPTNGKPLNLALPCRPARKSSSPCDPPHCSNIPKEKKYPRPLGPTGQRGLRMRRTCDHSQLSGMDQLIIGCQVNERRQLALRYVVACHEAITREALLDARLHGAEQKHIDGKTYWLGE